MQLKAARLLYRRSGRGHPPLPPLLPGLPCNREYRCPFGCLRRLGADWNEAASGFVPAFLLKTRKRRHDVTSRLLGCQWRRFLKKYTVFRIAVFGDLNTLKCKGGVGGLLDPRSLHKEYLSPPITVTRDVYIPCNRSKSEFF